MNINPSRLALALTLALASPMALASTSAPEHHGQAEIEETRDADRPDSWVTTKVKSKLAMSSEISALDINVDTENGVTTLRGTVDNKAQEEEALRLARETVGANEVRSALVVNPRATDRQRDRNEMTPAERQEERREERQEHREDRQDRTERHLDRTADNDADRPDAWVETKVKSKLAMSSEVSSLDINADVDDGVVTLRGTVDNKAQEEEALRLTRETVGANEVRSALVINPRATDRQRDRNEMTPAERREDRRDHTTRDDVDTDRPDAWVLTKVKSQMLASSEVGGLDINVDVNDGVVTLRGDVETQAEANEAVRIAQSTEGVKRVNSQLAISRD